MLKSMVILKGFPENNCGMKLKFGFGCHRMAHCFFLLKKWGGGPMPWPPGNSKKKKTRGVAMVAAVNLFGCAVWGKALIGMFKNTEMKIERRSCWRRVLLLTDDVTK